MARTRKYPKRGVKVKPTGFSLGSAFQDAGVDDELVERVRAAREGLDAEVTVNYLPVFEDGERLENEPGDWSLSMTLIWQGQPAGGFSWRWSKREPEVLYWTAANFSDRLRGTSLFGPLIAELVDFFYKRLGFEEVYAVEPNEDIVPVIRACGMEEVERTEIAPDGPRDVVQWGGWTGRGAIREHVRWRLGFGPEPSWRKGMRADLDLG